jgi:hypothetical protein
MRQNGAARHCIAITDNTHLHCQQWLTAHLLLVDQNAQRSFGLRAVGRPLKTSDS